MSCIFTEQIYIMISNFHSINYSTNCKSKHTKPNTVLLFAVCANLFLLLSVPNNATAQISFSIPNIDSLCNNVDSFYNRLTQAQQIELKQSDKYKWLNYLPSPGYSPFTGGLSLNLNLAAPLQAINQKHVSKQKAESIGRINALAAEVLKNEIRVDFNTIQFSIQEFQAKDSLQILKLQAFRLYSSQYQRNEITPSDFLGKQQDFESFKIQRLAEANQIKKAIQQLFIKSKMAIVSTDDHLKM
jgi:hypothetical protein